MIFAFGVIFGLILDFGVALQFASIAEMKGHEKWTYFWWCFILTIFGMLMVIALPDRSPYINVQRDDQNAENQQPSRAIIEKESSPKTHRAMLVVCGIAMYILLIVAILYVRVNGIV